MMRQRCEDASCRFVVQRRTSCNPPPQLLAATFAHNEETARPHGSCWTGADGSAETFRTSGQLSDERIEEMAVRLAYTEQSEAA